jgi:prepilin-type processing-associated H-X9-DG protein
LAAETTPDLFGGPIDSFRWLPQPRTRSYSLNCWLNGMAWPEGTDSRFIRASQLVTPGPSMVFAFLDEHPDTIEDGHFALNHAPVNNWQNVPADRHDQSANFSYADGHAAVKKWRWTKTRGDQVYGRLVANNQDMLDLRDLQTTIPQ